MLNSNLFRAALMISAVIHAAVIGVSSLPFRAKETHKENRLEVTYIFQDSALKERKPVIERIPEIYDVKKKLTKISGNDIKIPDKSPASKNTEPAIKDEASKDGDQDYIRYHSLIRDRIKTEVARNYTRKMGEGKVELIFTVTRDGQLAKMAIDDSESIGKLELRQIAIKSLQSAAPFPPFPDSLEAEDLILCVLVVFKDL